MRLNEIDTAIASRFLKFAGYLRLRLCKDMVSEACRYGHDEERPKNDLSMGQELAMLSSVEQCSVMHMGKSTGG